MIRKTVLLTVVALAASIPMGWADAEESGPFRATFELNIEEVLLNPPEYDYFVRGTGTATHLGKSEIRAAMFYSPGEFFGFEGSGGSNLYTANGSEYNIEFGIGYPTADPSVFAGTMSIRAPYGLTGPPGDPSSFPHHLFLDFLIIDQGDGTLSLIMQGDLPY